MFMDIFNVAGEELLMDTVTLDCLCSPDCLCSCCTSLRRDAKENWRATATEEAVEFAGNLREIPLDHLIF